jgi:hypothetical protein
MIASNCTTVRINNSESPACEGLLHAMTDTPHLQSKARQQAGDVQPGVNRQVAGSHGDQGKGDRGDEVGGAVPLEQVFGLRHVRGEGGGACTAQEGG